MRVLAEFKLRPTAVILENYAGIYFEFFLIKSHACGLLS